MCRFGCVYFLVRVIQGSETCFGSSRLSSNDVSGSPQIETTSPGKYKVTPLSKKVSTTSTDCVLSVPEEGGRGNRKTEGSQTSYARGRESKKSVGDGEKE